MWTTPVASHLHHRVHTSSLLTHTHTHTHRSPASSHWALVLSTVQAICPESIALPLPSAETKWKQLANTSEMAPSIIMLTFITEHIKAIIKFQDANELEAGFPCLE